MIQFITVSTYGHKEFIHIAQPKLDIAQPEGNEKKRKKKPTEISTK